MGHGVGVREGVAVGGGVAENARVSGRVGLFGRVASGVVTRRVGVVSRGRVGVKLGVGVGVGSGEKKEQPHKSQAANMLARIPSDCITF